MKVIYNPTSKKIYRAIEDTATYTSDLPFETVYVEAFTNTELVTELKTNPHLIVYNPDTNVFTKGEQTWTPNSNFNDDIQTNFIANLPSLEQMLGIVNGAQTIDELKQILAMVVRGCYALANRVIN